MIACSASDISYILTQLVRMIYSSMNEIDTHLLEPLVLPRHLGVLLQMGRIGLFEILDASNTLLQCFPLDVKLWSGMLVRDAVV